jgi:diguanylate cyclase (GGDEF)-like protein
MGDMAAGDDANTAGIRGTPLGRRIMPWYVSWVALLAVVGSVWPHGRSEMWVVMSITVLAAVVVGPLINRPAQRIPWLLLAAAVATLLVGGAVAYTIDGNSVLTTDFSIADAVDLIAYPLAAAGLLMLVMRRSSPLAVLVSAVDALIVLACLTLLTWVLLIGPLVGPEVPSGTYRAMAVSFSFGDVLLLVISVRLLIPWPRERPMAAWLLGAGTLGLLGADVLYCLVELHGINSVRQIGAESTGSMIWLIGAAAWGAAALSPTMVQVDRRGSPGVSAALGRTPAKTTSVVARSALFVLLALVGPVIAVRHKSDQAHDYGVLIAVLSGVIAVLLAARLGLVLLDLRRQLRVEQNLRSVSGIMVGAAEIRQILAAVYQAGTSQSGKHQLKIVACAVVTDHLRTVTADTVGDATAKVPGTGAAEWIHTQFGAQPHVVVTPPGMSADEAGFIIGVAGGEESVAGRIGQLEIIASQALLAVNRLVLTRQVARRSGQEYFRVLAENTSDVILIVGPEARVRYATPSASVVLGMPNPTEVGLAELVGPQNSEWVGERLARPEDPARPVATTTWTLRQSGRGKQAIEVACADLRAEPAVGGLVLTLRDVTARRQLEHELRYHAYYDTVTGLGNRLQFARRVELAMSRSRYGAAPATVLLLDIDDFKELNDVRGREVGDLILVAVADRLAKVVGDGDVGRLESDAFGVLAGPGTYGAAADADGGDNDANGDALARRLVEEISRPFELPVGVVTITVSVGVASTRGHSRADEVIRSAKLALEAAQADGRRAWRRYEPAMLEAKVEHAAMRQDLETSLRTGGFVLHYQPVVDLADGRISSFEALVRWRHPRRGLILPDRFIPLAESTGLIVPLGRWILRQSAHDLARLRAASGNGSPPVQVAVNVSARQFALPGLIDEVGAALAEARVDPGGLVVELTESALVRRKDRAVQDLHALKGLGVKLAIDDFGTGYSSLSYLQDFPFDCLKIDKSFVDDIAISDRRAELIRGIIRIADTLGLYVIGEGVESPEQHRLLAEAGCRYGQGFLYSRPVPVEAAEALLEAGGYSKL